MDYGVLRHDEGRSERAVFIIDKMGIIQYIDIHDIDDQPDNQVLFEEIKRICPEDYQEDDTPLDFSLIPQDGVVMFCTSWCPDCRKARAWLREHEIPYTEIDINLVPAGDARVREWVGGKLITPTFNIDGEVVIDFDQEKLRELLLRK
jgi:glutaredoxin